MQHLDTLEAGRTFFISLFLDFRKTRLAVKFDQRVAHLLGRLSLARVWLRELHLFISSDDIRTSNISCH